MQDRDMPEYQLRLASHTKKTSKDLSSGKARAASFESTPPQLGTPGALAKVTTTSFGSAGLIIFIKVTEAL